MYWHTGPDAVSVSAALLELAPESDSSGATFRMRYLRRLRGLPVATAILELGSGVEPRQRGCAAVAVAEAGRRMGQMILDAFGKQFFHIS